jgi:hydrogenase maturation protease
MKRRTTLVLGLGNDLISDDGFGPAVACSCRALLADHPDVTVEAASVAGLNLLDLLQGHDRALIVDVVQTGTAEPGTLTEWPVARASAGRTLGGSHQTDLVTTLALGRSLGYPLPDSITLLVAEAEDLLTVCERLTPAVATSVPIAAEMARRWVETGALSGMDRRADWTDRVPAPVKTGTWSDSEGRADEP